MKDNSSEYIKHPKKHWDLFIKECKFWLNFFGLKGWDMRYVHDCDEGSAGSYWMDVEARKITINLSKETPKWLCDMHEVKLTAFHEIVESALLGKLKEFGKHRYVQEREINEATHEIVAILENSVFEMLHGDKKAKKKNKKKK